MAEGFFKVQYKAASLDEIAAFFDQRAADLKTRSVGSKLRRDGQRLLIESATWTEAADILRHTTLERKANE